MQLQANFIKFPAVIETPSHDQLQLFRQGPDRLIYGQVDGTLIVLRWLGYLIDRRISVLMVRLPVILLHELCNREQPRSETVFTACETVAVCQDNGPSIPTEVRYGVTGTPTHATG